MTKPVVWRPCPVCGRQWPHPAGNRAHHVDDRPPLAECDLTCLVCKETELAAAKRKVARLTEEMDDEGKSHGMLASLLRRTCDVLKGPPPELTLFSWHDLPETAKAIMDAIRTHRDQRGDDRCWMDDEMLYSALPEGYARLEVDTAVELTRCEQFIAHRHNPGTTYVSPQREIERLTSTVATQKRLIAALQGETDG